MSAPDVSQVAPPQPMPDLGPVQTPTPVLAGSPGSPQYAAAQNTPPRPQPIIAQLIRGLTNPQMVAPAPGQEARPVSRLSTFEDFLGNFVNALGHGLAAAHGPGSFGKGFGAAVGAPYEQAQQQFQQGQAAQANQAEIQQRQAQTQLEQTQARIAGSTVMTPYGPMSPALASKVFPAAIREQGQVQSAGIAAQAKLLSTAMTNPSLPLDPMLAQAAGHPEWANQPIGKAQLAALNSEINTKTKLVGTSKTGEQIREDSDGNLVKIPVSSTSRPNLPAGPTAQGSPPQAAPSGFPKPRAAGGGQKVVAKGKSAADVGVAFNPQSGEYVQTTRSDAAGQGLQQFNKITAKEQDDNRQLNNRLSDVAMKITRYDDAINQPVSDKDRQLMAGLLASDKFKVGAFGTEVSVDRLNQLMDQENVKGMSPQGKSALLAYINARESMVGYQRVLSGSARGGEKQLELNLAALPSPVNPSDYVHEGVRQFKENVGIAGQGLPRMPGITSAKDIFAGAEKVQVQIPGQAPGFVPRGRLADFQKKYPSARVIQ